MQNFSFSVDLCCNK